MGSHGIKTCIGTCSFQNGVPCINCLRFLFSDWRHLCDDVSDLHYAAFYGDLISVKRIIKEASTDADVATTDGPKLLKEANAKGVEIYGHENYVGFFLDSTPLMMAAQQGHVSVVKYLVEHAHVDVNARDSVGLTPLALACSFDQNEVAKYLLTRHARRNILDARHGMSPLILASLNNHTDMCKFLLNHHVMVHIADSFGRQASHYAAWNYNWRLVEFLWHYDNRSINAQDHERNTPLHLLVSDDTIEPEKADDITSDAEVQNISEVIKHMSKFGNSTADIKRENKRGTQLPGEEYECMVRMLQLDASVTICNDKGQTVLHMLCARLTPIVYSQCYLYIENPTLTQTLLVMLKILIKSGCRLDEHDFRGMTPLALSVKSKNWLAAKLLSTDSTIRSEVTVDKFNHLADTVAAYGWSNLFEHKQVERDIEHMSSAVLLQHKEC